MASQNIPLYIPTYIGSINYDPTRVLPRLFFYNGQVDCQPYWLQGFQYNSTSSITPTQFTNFPYFDNYNVVSGQFPTTDSRSLLYNNENASYGEIPTENLYTTYWSIYVDLLYNPKTKLLNASAIIPLADYFNMELNDVVNFRGNYYHLRAINDYSVKTGECNLQLLGPIIPDTFYQAPIGAASSSVSWSYTESAQDGEFKVYNNAATIATLTTNGSGSTQVTQSNYVTASLAPLNFPSTGSVTMSLNINGGGFNISRSTSINETISASFLVGAGQKYSITGSTIFTQLSSSISWSYTENSQDGTFTIFDNSTTVATLTANGNGNSQISQSHYVTASLVPVSYPGAGVTMSINVNGGTTLAVTGSTNTTITASFLVGVGQIYGITGSITYNAPPTPPNYVAGASLIYDFGYATSYPGTGTTVYDVSGNSINGTLTGTPSWSSTKGGSLSVNSSNYITYSGKFPAAYTVQAFYKLTSGTSPAYPVIGGQANNNGVQLAIDTGWPSNSGVYQTYYYGASGNTSAGAANDANANTNIQNVYTFFSARNNGTNSQAYYVNTGSVSTSTNSHDRTLFTPTNQTVTIGNQGTGELVAWLVYPFVLSGAEITQNFNIFNAR